MPKGRERRVLPLSIATALLSGAGWLAFLGHVPLGAYNDDAHYYLGATAIARFGRFLNLCLPGHPSQTTYAIGYPVLIAPLVKLFPGSLGPIHLFQLGAFFLASWLLIRMARNALSFQTTMLLLLSWFACVFPTSLSSAVMSDIPYLALSLAPFALIEAESLPEPWLPAALAVGVLLAVLVRPVGALLVPAVALDAWLKKPRRVVFAFLGWLAAGALAASALSFALSGGHEAMSFIPAPLLRGLESMRETWSSRAPYAGAVLHGNALFYGKALLDILVFAARPLGSEPAAALIPLLVLGKLAWLAALATGAWVGVRRFPGLWLYGALFGAFLLVWLLVDLRYLIPLRPMFLLAAALGFERWERSWPRATALKQGVFAAMIYLGAFDLWIQRMNPVPLFERKHAWIKAHTAPDARIADEADGSLHWYTRRFAYSYPWDRARSPREVIGGLVDQGVRYFVATPELAYVQPSDAAVRDAWREGQRAAAFAWMRSSGAFELVFGDDRSRIYKWKEPRSAPTMRAGSNLGRP